MKLPSPASLVPMHYVMDPDQETLLTSGFLLKDGMVILIENPNMRQDLDKLETQSNWALALERNRWMTISQVHMGPAGVSVTFVATYDDGSQRKLRFDNHHAWLVKHTNDDIA